MVGQKAILRGWRDFVGVASLALVASTCLADQMAFRTYHLLREGMSMSEVLVRAGPPDLVTDPGGEVLGTRLRTKTMTERGAVDLASFHRLDVRNAEEWHYIPRPNHHDPWITVVTFRGGRIFDLERTKVFSRYRGAPAGATGTVPAPGAARDADGDGVGRAVEAARDYATTRARLKARLHQGREPSPPPRRHEPTPIYRGIDADGASYFGDVPMP